MASDGYEHNLMALSREGDWREHEESLHADKDDTSSLGSMFNASISSLRSYVEHAMVSIKDNVESEIVLQPTVDEVAFDKAVKHEKETRIRNIVIGDEEFRQFKKTMIDNKVVTSNAVNYSIMESSGRRVTMDMQNQKQRSVSMNLSAEKPSNLLTAGFSSRHLGA